MMKFKLNEGIRKLISFDTKAEIDEDERTATGYITTPGLDRDGEIVLPLGADLSEFEKTRSVLYNHDTKLLPVGKMLWMKRTAKGILAKTQFATHQLAEDVWQMVKGGFLNAHSIGFRRTAISFPSSPDFKQLISDLGVKSKGVAGITKKWTLFEYSIVPVPANADALVSAVSKNLISVDTLKRLEIPFEMPVVEKVPEELEKEIEEEIEEPIKIEVLSVPTKKAKKPIIIEETFNINVQKRPIVVIQEPNSIETLIDLEFNRKLGRV